MGPSKRYAARGFGFAMHGARAATLNPYPGFELSGAETVLKAMVEARSMDEESESGGLSCKEAFASSDYDAFVECIRHCQSCKWGIPLGC